MSQQWGREEDERKKKKKALTERRTTTETEVVKSILKALQGLPTPLFSWNPSLLSFSLNPSSPPIHLSHLSILTPFLHAATSLHLLSSFLTSLPSPLPLTLSAFSSSASRCLHKLHSSALHQELNLFSLSPSPPPTLLSLSSSLSPLFHTAHHLLDVMLAAFPPSFLTQSPPPSSISAHIINTLYHRLDRVCLLHGRGEALDDTYHMLLFLFVGTLLPYVQMLDSWLFQGVLNDPFEEMFFSADTSLPVEHPLFWDRGYVLREGDVVPRFLRGVAGSVLSAGKSLQLIRHGGDGVAEEEKASGLTFSEVFLVSLTALIGEGDRLFGSLKPCGSEIPTWPMGREKQWHKLLNSAISRKRDEGGRRFSSSIWPLNPVIGVRRGVLEEDSLCDSTLVPLDDEKLRREVFGEGESRGTDYNRGFRNDSHGYLRPEDAVILDRLLPFPTLVPELDEDFNMADAMPFQRNSTLSSTVLNWIEETTPKRTPLPLVLTEECLLVYIKREVDSIGRGTLQKLMREWRLMETLGILRAVHLLGSGDLLHHFFATVFRKLDRGGPCEDEFELNTILQESIRNSCDSGTISASPESLVVFVSRKQRGGDPVLPTEGGFECLKFRYRVPWPLEIVVTERAVEKYDGVMGFLMKVKRAKYVLDKCRRLIWMRGRRPVTVKGKGKRQWLVEQKLLHFVDVFHQYVMERVYHNAWCELCEGVGGAGCLDEVVRVHESYLVSIQRQCFVAHDKLGALIATRVNCILKLAVDFYSLMLSTADSSSSASVKAELEADRVEKQFDDCVAFLLRVLSLKLNAGNLPHLANLVTRINYNYYYMSESGTVMVAPDTSGPESRR